MKTKIFISGFEGFDHHYKFIDDEVETIIGKFEQEKKMLANVSTKCTGKHTLHSPRKYECEVRLFTNRSKRTLFFKKVAKDFYSAVRMALKAAEKSLRRESKTRVSRYRKSFYDLNFITVPIRIGNRNNRVL